MNNPNVKKGLDFEKKCLEKLKELGFADVKLTNHTDYGADIVAIDGKIKYIFQCKFVKRNQGVKSVQEILTAKHYYAAHRCVVVSESKFSQQAYKLAQPNYCYLITSIDFFNLQDRSLLVSDSIDKLSQVGFNYDIIKSYEELKKKIGKTPTLQELDKTLRYRINKVYGNYSSFIKKIGDSLSKSKPTEEQLKNEYKRIRSIVGKTLTGSDIKKHSTFPYNSFHSYPLTKLQKECGDRPNIERGITKQNLISEYLALAKKLGKNPNGTDLDNHGQYRYSYYVPHRWENFSAFLKEANIPESKVTKRRYSENETVLMFSLIELLIKIKENNFNKEINTTVLKNLKYNEKTLFSKVNVSSKRFNSYDNFIKTINKDEKYKSMRIKLQSLVSEFLEN